MSNRILLVEDDQVTRDIVSGILAARGYQVETADDGVSGVERLARGGYDLALIDYHLPDVDGYASARLAGSVVPLGQRPKLVALTADPRSLMARDGVDALFDAVLAKPFEPSALCGLLEGLLADPRFEAAVAASRERWAANGLHRRPRAFAVPTPTAEQAFALRHCFDLADNPAEADFIALLDPAKLEDLVGLRRRDGAHLLPAVDLTAARMRELDAAFLPEDDRSWAEVAEAIVAFRERADKLTPAVRNAGDAATRLLARLFVSRRALEPVPDPAERRLFAYSGAAEGERVAAVADELAAKGLLARSFADRFHACGACQSHRLNVREECGACRSPDVREIKLLRHFRCNASAPEDEFRTGGWFTCPCCERRLGKYGEDYVRAGATTRCRACGEARERAAIGFVCLDCGARHDSEQVETRDVHAYALTARGARAATIAGFLA